MKLLTVWYLFRRFTVPGQENLFYQTSPLWDALHLRDILGIIHPMANVWIRQTNCAKGYNVGLKKLLNRAMQKLKGAIILQPNSYNFSLSVIENGEAYGT